MSACETADDYRLILVVFARNETYRFDLCQYMEALTPYRCAWAEAARFSKTGADNVSFFSNSTFNRNLFSLPGAVSCSRAIPVLP